MAITVHETAHLNNQIIGGIHFEDGMFEHAGKNEN